MRRLRHKPSAGWRMPEEAGDRIQTRKRPKRTRDREMLSVGQNMAPSQKHGSNAFGRLGANIAMFGVVVIQLLKLMGRRETVPSAMDAEDIRDALNRLRKSLVNRNDANAEINSTHVDGEVEAPISIETRAGSLIELLEAAAEDGVAAIWEGH